VTFALDSEGRAGAPRETLDDDQFATEVTGMKDLAELRRGSG
jgi:hypothetical protein